MLRKWKVDVICLQETKLKLISRRIIRSIWNCQFVGWIYLPSKGASGGILVMWDKRVVECIDEFIGEYSVGCSFKNSKDGFLWAFARVYGPNLDSERRRLWDELAGLCSSWEVP
ncbi:hypothetical protein CIPAW_01G132400 [Carya illinoinensis]|uniref:Uncharacterized protein n=1 Tax=Carya illinoinensis TaxID=32201 RepID=A0A8T1RMJ0_CARIL|nr:hypothetical protein CIPAW_01G132400 [Carya illinoinensis]